MNKHALVLLALSATAGSAFGAGFEKTILWSGKHTGVAGAGVAGHNDSQSVYFNPAGLGDLEKGDAAVNFSPTLVRLQGPITGNEEKRYSDQRLIPIGGVTAAMPVTPWLGVGVGAYVAGGNRAYFNNVNFQNLSPTFDTLGIDVISRLDLIEYALGIGVEVLPGLKLGGAWRINQVFAELKTPFVSGTGLGTHLVELHFNELSGTKYNGFRLGVVYDAPPETSHPWGLGAMLRSSVSFELDGDLSGRAESVLPTASVFNLTGGATTVANKFPMQIAGGGYVDVVKNKWRVLGEYSFTEYSQNEVLSFTGTVSGGSLGTLNAANASIRQEWKDLHIFRLGNEVRPTGGPLALRAGYALTTKVTPKRYARSTFSSPGIGHSITAGAGYRFLDDHLEVDGALEYSFASGTVNGSDVVGTATRTGEYATRAMAVHTGLSYRF